MGTDAVSIKIYEEVKTLRSRFLSSRESTVKFPFVLLWGMKFWTCLLNKQIEINLEMMAAF